MKNIYTIAKKELRSYFNSPTAYIVLIVFLLLWEFLFFRNFFQAAHASLRVLFDFLPWIFLVIIPALTMGSIAQEKSDGTIELVLTRPIKEFELIIGKFLGSLCFIFIALLFVIPIAWSVSKFGQFDFGVVAGQFVASIFLAAVLISLGIFVSSLFSNQISSLLSAVLASFFLVISGFEIVTSRLPLSFVPFFEQLSVLTHFYSTARGVIDTRDVWYFLSISAAFLSLAYLALLKNKLGNQKKVYKNFQFGVIVFLGIVITTNIIGSNIPGRIDLTEEKAYTLTDSTKKIVSGLDDIVEITLFASDKLPAQLQPVLREIDDVLRDYQTLGKGNIVTFRKNPSADEQVALEAASFGVQEIRFDVISNEEFQSKNGYLGIALSYGGEYESIPFVEETSGLEYQLTSFIRKLTVDDKKKISFVTGHGEIAPSSQARLLKQELEKLFSVEEISPLEEESSQEETSELEQSEEEATDNSILIIPDDTDVLVVAGPKKEIGQQGLKEIKSYVARGGNALFLVNNVEIMPQTMSPALAQIDISKFLKDEYGITVNDDLVFDLRSNETVSVGGGFFTNFVKYPFFVKSNNSDKPSAITSSISNVTLPWTSSVSIQQQQNIKAEQLLVTTPSAGRQTGQFDISTNQKFTESGLEKQTLAVLASIEKEKKSRIIVVGDADFISDSYVRNNIENVGFAISAISWLAQEESLAEIQLKNKASRGLVFDDKNQPSLIKYGNFALALLAPSLFGGYRMMKRRKMKQKKYEK